MSATTPQRQLAEEERRRLELEARGGLDQLVQLLTKAASDAWHDQRLWGHGDGARYFGRSADLIMTVDKLSKVILDHPDAGVRTERLVALHDALEAAAIIGGCLKTPAANRLRTVAVTEKRRQQARAQVPRTAEIIEDEFISSGKNTRIRTSRKGSLEDWHVFSNSGANGKASWRWKQIQSPGT